jgi:hypothetical protein
MYSILGDSDVRASILRPLCLSHGYCDYYFCTGYDTVADSTAGINRACRRLNPFQFLKAMQYQDTVAVISITQFVARSRVS